MTAKTKTPRTRRSRGDDSRTSVLRPSVAVNRPGWAVIDGGRKRRIGMLDETERRAS